MSDGSYRNAQVMSKYKAFPPDGGPYKLVKLTHFKKTEYEAKGWRFERTTLSAWS